MAKRFYEPYAGKMESKKMMNRDGAMLREDYSAPALLPQEVVNRVFPSGQSYMGDRVADLFMGVQKQLKADSADLRRATKPAKY
jgi:hypothetical protein